MSAQSLKSEINDQNARVVAIVLKRGLGPGSRAGGNAAGTERGSDA